VADAECRFEVVAEAGFGAEEPVSAAEVAVVEAHLPELLKVMLTFAEPEEEDTHDRRPVRPGLHG
jgi:hypothetical protein